MCFSLSNSPSLSVCFSLCSPVLRIYYFIHLYRTRCPETALSHALSYSLSCRISRAASRADDNEDQQLDGEDIAWEDDDGEGGGDDESGEAGSDSLDFEVNDAEEEPEERRVRAPIYAYATIRDMKHYGLLEILATMPLMQIQSLLSRHMQNKRMQCFYPAPAPYPHCIICMDLTKAFRDTHADLSQVVVVVFLRIVSFFLKQAMKGTGASDRTTPRQSTIMYLYQALYRCA